VHADNAPAMRLYEGLGFRRQSATTDLRRPAAIKPAPLTDQSLDLALRPVSWRDWRQEYELALLTTPPDVWQVRAVRESQYRRGPVGALLERLAGQRIYRRAVASTGNAADRYAADRVDALVKLEGKRPYRLTLLVRPARQAELAEPLAAHVAQVLSTWPPADAVAQVWAAPPHLAEALQRHGFVAELTTVRMALDLRQHMPIPVEGQRA
ncbi:MAG: hypothetical protein KJ734_03105, partial [Chloroflexi bacterium]|nr:hypothetical protein [Chloroflexota bacterium]